MNDDELRQRLQAMPEPTTTIDVDAVVADARRRRRPKVIGTGVAVGAACLAFLAPVVVPGLLGPDPVTATLQEQGVAEQGDSGAQPEAPAPAATDESAPTAGDEPDATTFTDGDAAESAGAAAGACAAVPAAQVADGLSLTFLAQPVDGEATLLVANASDETLVVRIGDVGIAAIEGDGVLASAAIDPASALAGFRAQLAPGDVERVIVDVATDLAPCAAGDSVDGTLVPVVAVAIGASAEVRGPALGDPTAS
ncbi:hypothetical protein [Agrococcus jejuensis]|uniref:Uncharacterized protein n=1 Tax=Agrococcus jejuensis TaxID=399736 RepID=A0A1G8AYY7_9MICO|nr:hypothetical protein [Agrococcus jejuensis]SDH26114.1 hypothetical protein SAMN04489720_0585 [Agrococcus jejuensis]